jgi:hypothetical protein
MDSLRIRLTYDGAGPVHWDGGADAFGVQDKAGVLHPGTPGAAGAIVFDLVLQVKSLSGDAVVLSGDFAHGSPAERFLYLGWRNAAGNFAQRLKLSLTTITASEAREAIDSQKPLVGTLVDHHPKATTTGANIGGSRAITWKLALR